LFESGRPVIVVPYIQKQGLTLGRVLACWDGSRTAARAIGDAMPFFARAKAVEIVVISEQRKRDDIDGAHMIEHFARHAFEPSRPGDVPHAGGNGGGTSVCKAF
jgi:hypothetical protein